MYYVKQSMSKKVCSVPSSNKCAETFDAWHRAVCCSIDFDDMYSYGHSLYFFVYLNHDFLMKLLFKIASLLTNASMASEMEKNVMTATRSSPSYSAFTHRSTPNWLKCVRKFSSLFNSGGTSARIIVRLGITIGLKFSSASIIMVKQFNYKLIVVLITELLTSKCLENLSIVSDNLFWKVFQSILQFMRSQNRWKICLFILERFLAIMKTKSVHLIRVSVYLQQHIETLDTFRD